jgi:transcriptional regulator with XRE-family HTH domain
MDYASLRKSFGEQVRRLRTRRGLTQQQLAERSGLHETHISRIERGQREPRVTTIYWISRGLSVEPAELFGEPTRRLAALEGRQFEELFDQMLCLSREAQRGERRKLQELEELILQAQELLRRALALIRETPPEGQGESVEVEEG